jgi:thiamine-monophosphate kinase
MMVLTTDMLAEGIHFDLTYMPIKHLGYKAVVVNLSDVYAMNALPQQIVVSIALSSRFSLDAVEELYAGMLAACDFYGVDLVGGDTTTSKSGIIINITAIGWANKEDIVYRSGAQYNDLICVTGDLGAAYMGLQLLNREKEVFLENPNAQPDFGGYDYLLERQLKPEARNGLYNLLRESGVKPTAMIDISDGLASELLHICKASACGCQIYEEKFPIDHLTRQLGMEFGIDPTVAALNGGEDYELLFTIPLSDYEKIKDITEISILGHVTDKAAGCIMVDRQNNVHEIKAQGWDALKDVK